MLITPLCASWRLLSKLGSGSLFSLKAQKTESNSIHIKIASKCVSFFYLPADCWDGSTFGLPSLAADAILFSHKRLYVKALLTLCAAAHFSHDVDVLCEMCSDATGRVAGYRFMFIDKLKSAAAGGGEGAGGMESEEDEDDEEDEEDEDGAIVVGTGNQKKISFCDAMLAVVTNAPLNKRMAATLRMQIQENNLLSAMTFQQFAATFSGDSDLLSLPINALKWKNNGLALHQVFTWGACERVMKRFSLLQPCFFQESEYVRRPMPSAGTEVVRQTQVVRLMFSEDATSRVLRLDACTLLLPQLFNTLRRPDVDLHVARRLRAPGVDEDVDQLNQIEMSAAAAASDGDDSDTVVRRAIYDIVKDAMHTEITHAYEDDGEKDKWSELQEMWVRAAGHWNTIVMNAQSDSCPGVSYSIRAWLRFVREEFTPQTYRQPRVPFTTKAGILSNFVNYVFANLEEYLLLLKQHSNFFKLWVMMLGSTLPRDNGRVVPFCVLCGQAMSSKSFLLDCLRTVMLPDTTVMVSSSTNKAGTTGYMLNMESILLYDEGTASHLQTATSASDPGTQAKQEMLKQILTCNDVTHQMAGIREHPLTKKRSKVLQTEQWVNYNTAMLMCTNHADEIDPAIRSRTHFEYFAPSKRSGKNISSLQSTRREGLNDPEWRKGHDDFIHVMQQAQVFHNMVTACMKSGLLPNFLFKVFDVYMQSVETHLQASGVELPTPRTKERMQCMVMSLTILRAWLSLYVYEGGMFYGQPPSFLHMEEWSRHVCCDSTEVVMQMLAMMGYSLVGEDIGKEQVLNVLYRYLSSDSCLSRKWHVNSIEDAKALFAPNQETQPNPAQDDMMGRERGCTVRQLTQAHLMIQCAQKLRDISPAHAKELLEQAKNCIANNRLDAMCSDIATGLGQGRDETAAAPFIEEMREKIGAEARRCHECRDCNLKAECANYVMIKVGPKSLATSLYSFWQNAGDLGEPMSEAEICRVFELLKQKTVTVPSVSVLMTKESHIGTSRTMYLENVGERKQRHVVFSIIGKNNCVINLGTIAKGFTAGESSVSIDGLLNACVHKYVEPQTLLLPVPSSIREPQFPKIFVVQPNNKVLKRKVNSVGRMQHRALGMRSPVLPIRIFKYVQDVELLAKSSVVKLLGLPHECEETIRREGRCSRKLEELFIERQGAEHVMSVSEYRETMQEQLNVITCSTELV